ncbi:hypothetical protein CF15_06085 [Pyrodictium occultum]|uniref:Uncharacterized protein n=1 Tax=Pyrodictium occultum TaxID=2309 RepID=A0A0V8RW69_PYROC|nr:hypothetical protein [Pyrodictium occultum]KSW12311.1 hypothetical protein CF15_06085 [Pyrodictium occultum]
MKSRILSLVEGAPRANQAAFYSDPYVSALVEELHRRWSRAGHRGEPIDFATREELMRLYELAEYYASLPEWKAYRIFMERRGEAVGQRSGRD